MNEFCGKLVNSIYTELISGTGFVYCYVIVMSNAYLIILTYYHNMTWFLEGGDTLEWGGGEGDTLDIVKASFIGRESYLLFLHAVVKSCLQRMI